MKHKKVKRGMVRPDTIFPLYNQIDGEWYAIITAPTSQQQIQEFFGNREAVP
jgi:hypothetical protein